MKDFDFDELDKAVSSVLNSDDSAKQSTQTNGVSSITNNDISKHSAGRFMDVVKPSLLSNNNDSGPSLAQKQNIVIEPVKNMSLYNSVDGVSVQDAGANKNNLTSNEPINNDLPMVDNEKDDLPAEQSQLMPDPIDFYNNISMPKTDENNEKVSDETIVKVSDDDKDLNKIADELNDSIKNMVVPVTKTDEPDKVSDGLTNGSPFLSSAKVEKRPLGAYSDIAQDNLGQDSNIKPEEVANNDNATEDDKAQENYPEEMQSRLMAIESAPIDNDSSLASLAINTDTLAKDDNKKQPIITDNSTMTIPQQYHEVKKEETSASSGIYDVENHQPLKYPAKKKSGFMTVIWILLIIILGGAAGAAVYFFVLPLL